MRPFKLLAVLLISLICSQISKGETNQKLRVFVLTDIENEPDDAQSLVRFLTYSYQWDVEGLVATTSCWQRDRTAGWRIHEIVDAYGKVRSNLEVHEAGYPSYDYMKSVIKEGVPIFGMAGVGEGNDSEGSEWLIKCLEKEDPRPIYLQAWGGVNVLAQALWKMERTKSKSELDKIISKIRVYTISDQDDSGPWIRNHFPNLFYIVSPGYQENNGNQYQYSTWIGISGDNFLGNFNGPDFALVDNPWLDEHIRSKGLLGEKYPQTEYLMEGDTPSFLGLIKNGLSDPERPNLGGWGGRYELYIPSFKEAYMYEPETRPIWTDSEDKVWSEITQQYHTSNQATIWRWRKAYQNDFAARMDWSMTNDYSKANHNPIAILNEDNTLKVLNIQSSPGIIIELSADGSTDPDGDSLNYSWFFYEEASSYKGRVTIHNGSSANIKVEIPEDAAGKDLHIIMQIHDDGEPNLYAYRRVIITVQPELNAGLPFMKWLYEYIPAQYPNVKMTDHFYWLQGQVSDNLVANWAQINDGSDLNYLEDHNLTQGKPLFIEKAEKLDWSIHPSVTYYEAAGYYISGYDSTTMRDWDIERCNVVQFDGNPKKFVEKMALDWVNYQSKIAVVLKNEDPVSGVPYKPFPDKVVVTKVRHFDNICWKIATSGGTWYFENGETGGMTGFSSAYDQAGNDWIGNDADRGYNKSSSKGGRHEYRGWPNFGEGNFNHPQRGSHSTSKWVDAAGNEIRFEDKLEGDHLVMRTSNPDYELEYHFFPSHAAIKILKADKKYAFLFEGPVGGEQEASVEKDYYVLKDGVHREIKAGGLGYLDPVFGNKFPSPFFYLVDSNPTDNQVLFIGVKNTGPETAGDEGWRQGENMVIFSFGRDDDKRAYTGTDAICVFGFHEKSSHKKITRFIESRLKDPFSPTR